LEADVDSDSEEEEVNNQQQQKQWSKKNPELVGTKTPPFIKPVLGTVDREKLEGLRTAYDFYREFSGESYINEIVYQSRLYAVQKGHTKSLELLNKDTVRCTEAMLLHSGYHGIPRRKMIWELKPDCRNELIASAIRRTEVILFRYFFSHYFPYLQHVKKTSFFYYYFMSLFRLTPCFSASISGTTASWTTMDSSR